MASGSSPSIRVKNRKPSDQKLYDTILNKMVDNPEDIPAYQIKPAETNLLQKIETQPAFYEYVIITSNALKSYFNKFVEWKKRKGIDIGVVTVEDIYSSYTGGDLISGIDDNAGKIRQYLLDAYTEGAVWALLGGDMIIIQVVWLFPLGMDAVKIEIVGMMVLIVGISILIKFLQIYILLILTGIGMLMQMSFMANHICFHLHWAMVAILQIIILKYL